MIESFAYIAHQSSKCQLKGCRRAQQETAAPET